MSKQDQITELEIDIESTQAYIDIFDNLIKTSKGLFIVPMLKHLNHRLEKRIVSLKEKIDKLNC